MNPLKGTQVLCPCQTSIADVTIVVLFQVLFSVYRSHYKVLPVLSWVRCAVFDRRLQ